MLLCAVHSFAPGLFFYPSKLPIRICTKRNPRVCVHIHRLLGIFGFNSSVPVDILFVCLYKACVRKAQVITARDGTNGNCRSHTAQPPTTRPVSSDAAVCRVSSTLVQYYIWVLITILAELNLFYSVLI